MRQLSIAQIHLICILVLLYEKSLLLDCIVIYQFMRRITGSGKPQCGGFTSLNRKHARLDII